MESAIIIEDLIKTYGEIRYVAIYHKDQLTSEQRAISENSSAGETDRYEELLVNPTMLTLARQRGNIDCGGLDYLLIRYGNFYQLIREIENGHISICLDMTADLNHLPVKICAIMN